MRGLAQRSLPALRAPRLAPRHSSPALLLDSFPFEQAGIGLKYWDLHGLLFIPTALLLTVGSPALLRPDGLSPLTRTACYAYIAFITCIAVAQAFVWDSVGAQIG